MVKLDWNWSDQLEVVEVVLGSSFCALALATVGAADELVMYSFAASYPWLVFSVTVVTPWWKPSFNVSVQLGPSLELGPIMSLAAS